MAQYAILRFAKHKGAPAGALESHHERQKENYASNPDIHTDRSKYNFHTVRPGGHYRGEIDSRIQAAGCRTRKDSTRFVDTLITASPAFFKGRKREDIRAFFQRATGFMCDRVGKHNIVSAVVHMDEATPHMHLVFVPLTEDNRLSAKDILGNRASMSQWQDDFYNHMAEAYPDLERGESAKNTGRKHIPTRVFKQAVHLTKQADRIQQTLDSITPFNASKKRDEVVSMLNKWFPGMENFETQVRKYKRGLVALQKENAQLAEKAKAGSTVKIKTKMEMAKLENDLRDLQRFVALIPDDLKQQIRAAQKIQQQRHQQDRE